MLRRLMEEARPDDEALAVRIAALPMQVRGFGHVKAKAIERFEAELQQLLAQWGVRGAVKLTTASARDAVTEI